MCVGYNDDSSHGLIIAKVQDFAAKMDRDTLLDLLIPCSARVLADGNVFGTALLVAPQLALTCRHVVDKLPEQGAVCEIWKEGQPKGPLQELSAFTIEYLGDDDESVDLALLRLNKPGIKHACACLLPGLFEASELLSYGFPAEFPYGDSLTLETEGITVKEEWQALKTRGKPAPGHSGSGLVNLKTGAVCGILYSRTVEAGAARAVPIKYALTKWPEIAQRASGYHTANPSWSSLLPDVRIRRNMEVVLDQMIRDGVQVENSMVGSPLTHLWQEFLSAEPWNEFIGRQIGTIETFADLLDNPDQVRAGIRMVSFGNSCEDSLPALRRVASEDRLRQAVNLRTRLQRDYGRARDRRQKGVLRVDPGAESAETIFKRLEEARRLANALWTLNRQELKSPSFQRAFLVMGSLGSGKTHFLGQVLGSGASSSLVIPISTSDLTLSPGPALLKKVSDISGVDWKTIDESAKFVKQALGVDLVFAVDDLQELLKKTSAWRAELLDVIRKTSGFNSLRWLLLLDEVSYHRLHAETEVQRTAEQRSWKEYGFSGARRPANKYDYEGNEFSLTLNEQAGGWLSLDSLNLSDETGVRLLEALYQAEDSSALETIKLLKAVSPGQTQLLSNPWVAWIFWEIRSNLPAKSALTLNYIEFVQKFWARHKLRVDRMEQPYQAYQTLAQLAKYLTEHSGETLEFDPVATYIQNARPDLNREIVHNAIRDSLQAEDLLRLKASDEEGGETITLSVPFFWAWKAAEVVMNWRELKDKNQWSFEQKLRPLISADRFGVDSDSCAAFVLLLLDSPKQRKESAELVDKTWKWVERESKLRASVWFAAGKAQASLQKQLVENLIAYPPLIGADDLRDTVALIHFVQTANPDAIGYGRRFEVLRPHYKAIAKCSLSAYFLLAVHRAMNEVGDTDSVLDALLALGESEVLGISQALAEAVYNALLSITGSANDCLPHVLDYLDKLSGENRVPEQKDRYFYQYFLACVARDYVGEAGPRGFWRLRELDWYKARMRYPISKEMAKEMNFSFGHWWRTTRLSPLLDQYVGLLRDLIEGKEGEERDQATTRSDREAAFFLIRHTVKTGEKVAVEVDRRFNPMLKQLYADPLLTHLKDRFGEFYQVNLRRENRNG